jgi:hypothetical protein
VLCLWKGDQPLRAAAIVILISWSVTPLVDPWGRDRLNVPQTMVDVATTVAMIWISVRWRRLWAAIQAALAILIVLCPFVALVDHRVHRNSWTAADTILTGIQILALLMAVVVTLRTRERDNEGAVRT